MLATDWRLWICLLWTLRMSRVWVSCSTVAVNWPLWIWHLWILRMSRIWEVCSTIAVVLLNSIWLLWIQVTLLIWVVYSPTAQNLQTCLLETNLPLLAQIMTFQKAPGTLPTAPPTPPTEIHVQYQATRPIHTQEDSFNWLQTTRNKNQDSLSSFLSLQEIFQWHLTNGRFSYFKFESNFWNNFLILSLFSFYQQENTKGENT